MASQIIDYYSLHCKDYANNFSMSLTNLLQQQNLIDVTLVADGHLFSAHRLILSAFSPYFQQMFAQMPTNQEAFVFLKDVPKETVEDLITFIYSGKVNVKQEHLEEFFQTAKALDIKGLADNGYANLFDVQSLALNSFPSNPNSLQYQSTRTIPVSNRAKSNLYEPSRCEQPMNGNEFGEYFCSGVDDGVSSEMDQEYAIKDDQWNDDSTYGAEEKPVKIRHSMRKRAKIDIDTTEYNTVADIRTNDKGQQNLFIADYKFGRHHRPNRHGQQRWQCTKRKLKNNCRASASTIEVNGIIMMKIVSAQHKH